MKRAALAAIAALLVAPAAFAAAPDNPLVKNSVALKLDHLDLATVDGQRTLAIRMDQAARDVCGDRLATIHLSLDAQSRACRTEVLADIRSRIEQRTAQAGGGSGVQVALR
ncbi:UrcA family protein [Sphingomonas bacterium]|uniref:UrcA family protein n=1 Tax=Sphingomonas bacterium TaxID=1895847 RepID=UPI001576D3D8|nr:UrcA family protein [Sphingomonas bacterium]